MLGLDGEVRFGRLSLRRERDESPTRAAEAPLSPDPRAILNSIGEVVYDWDLATDRLSWGANAHDVLGGERAGLPVTGVAFADRLAPESGASRYEAVMSSGERDAGAGVGYQVQYGLVREEGAQARTWIEDTGRWFGGLDGRPARAHGVIRVINERYEADRRLAFRSRFDPLTGALNRADLVEHMTRKFALAQRPQGVFAVVLASVDHLVALNRNYGYDVADEIIAAVADRLRAQMRATDVIARYAGNKFALVLDACDSEQMAVAAARFAEAVAAAPVDTNAGPLPAAIRLGGAIAPRHARNPQALLQHAEEALDCARQQPSTRFIAYEPSLVRDDVRMRTIQVADEIVSALNQRRLTLAYQPIVRAGDHEPAMYEALMRLHREDGSSVSPAAIIPIAEKVGLVQLIDQRVLELALADLCRDPDLSLAINASGATAHDPDWAGRVQAALALHPTAAARLTIELTETFAIEDIEQTRRIIASMKALGLRVAMDDFGAGHTSFRNLRRLEVDLLKIDGAFVQNLSRSPDDRFFVRTLVGLARHLEIPTVAEWVEDAETARMLADWGVDYLQGHYFGAAQHAAPASRRAAVG